MKKIFILLLLLNFSFSYATIEENSLDDNDKVENTNVKELVLFTENTLLENKVKLTLNKKEVLAFYKKAKKEINVFLKCRDFNLKVSTKSNALIRSQHKNKIFYSSGGISLIRF